VGKGTGLGLAMVFGFAKQSGGHVEIASEPGEGTTVRLFLPRAFGLPLPVPRTDYHADPPCGSASVLVVEDEAGVREVAGTILRELGYHVLEAADGPAALRLSERYGGAVDLAVIDIALPGGMDGVELARLLTGLRPRLRTLFMSGHTGSTFVRDGRIDEGRRLIGKPFEREAFARKVAEALEAVDA
ncbi:MAG: response regulator, partial [Acetobacteraceae bacterium]